MRLFTGLDLPPHVTGNLEALLLHLRPLAQVQWSPAANLHVTTKFIGEWPEDRLGDLKEALGQLPDRPAIPVKIQGLGFFPNPRAPRHFWCGIEAPGLAELAADTDGVTGSLGIPHEKRAYFPPLDAGAHEGNRHTAVATRGYRRIALAGVRELCRRPFLSVPERVAASWFRVH